MLDGTTDMELFERAMTTLLVFLVTVIGTLALLGVIQ
jgi:hypothetical protein